MPAVANNTSSLPPTTSPLSWVPLPFLVIFFSIVFIFAFVILVPLFPCRLSGPFCDCRLFSSFFTNKYSHI
ncbi:hypothetical protein RB195_001715 [Necator americanus]|uniref:Transmembrane protein n=1 Tax=Necator americanus TaxID=51031 RepID=A0ABR1DFL8_NECAM